MSFFSCPDHTLSFQTHRYRSASVERFHVLDFSAGSLSVFVLWQHSTFLQVFSAPRDSCAKSVEFLFLLGDWVLDLREPILELSEKLAKVLLRDRSLGLAG